MICREAVVGEAMTRRFPPEPKGPIVGGVPPLEGGPGAGALEAP